MLRSALNDGPGLIGLKENDLPCLGVMFKWWLGDLVGANNINISNCVRLERVWFQK